MSDEPLGVYCITCSAAAGTPCDDLFGALPLAPEGYHRARLTLGPSGIESPKRCPHGIVELPTIQCRDCTLDRARRHDR